ncbi:MAG: hypothetical protein F2811_03430, partial [Actinobacteria bacterium]|nr:hypothetical protein [Actinomycetota bacterium]
MAGADRARYRGPCNGGASMTDTGSSGTKNEGTAGAEPAATSLAALIGVPTLQAIQDTFATVFGLPTSIVNADGTPVTAITNRVPFCEDLT